MSNRIEQRLRANAVPHGVTRLASPTPATPCPAPLPADTPDLGRRLSLGGSIDGLVAGRPRVLAFLKDALAAD